ncbi:MAG: glutamate synthase subunit beta [Spirochaetes bacterium]|nr:glutamate synthase subunit beta [Spirochaetota bacterium]
MGNPSGFLNIKREEGGYRPIEERVRDYHEVEQELPEQARKLQASRCMDCGVPFCHWACPVSNMMPEWQDMIYRGDYKAAYGILQETNNFPEFTGRVCPALCEASCVLSINDEAVTIRNNELFVIEKAFKEGYVVPRPPKNRTGKRIAVIGSGPAGLACADILNKAGHTVVLYEAEDSVGGYLRFGIPDFKLNKNIIDRRVNILKQEGLIVKTGVRIGSDILKLKDEFDAICLTIGAREPRNLEIPGRDLTGIYFAMEYLTQQNKIVRGDVIPEQELIRAYNKNVVVIGGGDTGSDCVGSANRQGAANITQIELLPKPPEHRTDDEPWPLWPKLLKTSSSHEEGCERYWNILTKRFDGDNGRVSSITAVQVEWYYDEKYSYRMRELPGTDIAIKADIVFLAMGFLHAEHELIKNMGISTDSRGNIKVNADYMTNIDGIFAAGDSASGASLVVRAISQGRQAAQGIEGYLNSL